jgi:hypothetical protein
VLPNDVLNECRRIGVNDNELAEVVDAYLKENIRAFYMTDSGHPDLKQMKSDTLIVGDTKALGFTCLEGGRRSICIILLKSIYGVVEGLHRDEKWIQATIAYGGSDSYSITERPEQRPRLRKFLADLVEILGKT